MARLALMFFILEEAARLDALEDARQKRIEKIRRLDHYRSNLMYNRALALNEEDFINKYCLSKTLFLNLVNQLTPLMKQTRRCDISVKSKVLIAITFYATGGYQNRYNTLISQQSISNCIKEVTDALNNKSIINAHIKFPRTIEERNMIKAKFEEEYHVPGIIGCIDATHIPIRQPKKNEANYSNGKNYSKKVQIVCDYDLNIINVNASFGGAMDDDKIFHQQSLDRHLAALNDRESVCLLGDSDYAQRAHLMTPIRNASRGSPEEHYNQIHALARNRVNRTMCLLKARWRCLLKQPPINYRPDTVWSIINACCVLHNICNRAHVFPPPNMQEVQKLIEREQSGECLSSAVLTGDELQRGLQARKDLVNKLHGPRNI